MKLLLYLVGLVWLAVACHSDIFPNDLLYRRWQPVQTRQGGGGWVADTSITLNDIAYQRNGMLVYRMGGQTSVSCGRADRFSRQQNEITFFVDVDCVYILRTEPLKYKATITQLTSNLLELTCGQTVSQYKSIN